ncbi:hypothetical protein DFP93_102229 [Aneurinibacillus soli]|uniref:Uncharacterized protein n=1 Tax=Aneurinibacillus soli TaxID=1500254 RepID=A0A0U5C6B6_9BACL|nr:hypothetical protein DFP93_102229 [Aneurinibacillus soli]BAU27523.1 hypothetical protein CB4_01697 [Aneurinibacillus soli]
MRFPSGRRLAEGPLPATCSFSNSSEALCGRVCLTPGADNPRFPATHKTATNFSLLRSPPPYFADLYPIKQTSDDALPLPFSRVLSPGSKCIELVRPNRSFFLRHFQQSCIVAQCIKSESRFRKRRFRFRELIREDGKHS